MPQLWPRIQFRNKSERQFAWTLTGLFGAFATAALIKAMIGHDAVDFVMAGLMGIPFLGFIWALSVATQLDEHPPAKTAHPLAERRHQLARETVLLAAGYALSLIMMSGILAGAYLIGWPGPDFSPWPISWLIFKVMTTLTVLPILIGLITTVSFRWGKRERESKSTPD